MVTIPQKIFMFVRDRLKVKRASNMPTTNRFHPLALLVDNEMEASTAL